MFEVNNIDTGTTPLPAGTVYFTLDYSNTSGTECEFLRCHVFHMNNTIVTYYSTNIHLFKVNNRNIKKAVEYVQS